MKIIFKSLAIILLFLFNSSCKIDEIIVIGNKKIKKQYRELPIFKNVELLSNAEVHITQGPEQSIEIEAEENILPIIQTFVLNQNLKININAPIVSPKRPIIIRIQMPDIEHLKTSGTGDIFTENVIEAFNLKLTALGTGSIKANVFIENNLNVFVDGTGDIECKGFTQSSDFLTDGTGDIKCFSLRSEESVVRINSTGDCETTSTKKLKATLNGTGDLYFKGSPKIDFRTNGTGKVHNSN